MSRGAELPGPSGEMTVGDGAVLSPDPDLRGSEYRASSVGAHANPPTRCKYGKVRLGDWLFAGDQVIDRLRARFFERVTDHHQLCWDQELGVTKHWRSPVLGNP